MLSVPSYLYLQNKEPLACGTHRAIFALDDHPALIVKVAIPRKAPPRNHIKRIKYAIKKRICSQEQRPLLREYSAYLRLKKNPLNKTERPPVAEFHGLVATDLGLGMLYEKMQTTDGQLGISLGKLQRTNRLHAYIPLLNDFAQRLFTWQIRANDINRGNIVLGSHNGTEQFFLVDGLGDSHAIPLRTWFNKANEKSLHKRLAKTAGRIDLSWNVDRRCFETM